MSQATVDILSGEALDQAASPLFQLPGELRHRIYCFALTDYPDPSPSKAYKADTLYARPQYFAPRISDTVLVQTCRMVYREAWFLPFLLREHTHFLTSPERAPPEFRQAQAWTTVRRTLEQIARVCGEAEMPGVDGLRVFAQMWQLERDKLGELLRATPLLRPQRITLTIRHTDWWYWEQREPLRFSGAWAAKTRLPASVRSLSIELESLEQLKAQVDRVAKGMCERWFFRGTEGTLYFSDAKGAMCTVSRWSGSSTWQGKHWMRDEAAPGRIDYYVKTVTFVPEHVLRRRGGMVAPLARLNAEAEHPDVKIMALNGVENGKLMQ